MSELSFDNLPNDSPPTFSILVHNIWESTSINIDNNNNIPTLVQLLKVWLLHPYILFQAVQGHGMLYWIALAMAFFSPAANRMEAALAKNEHDKNTKVRVHSPGILSLKQKHIK